MGDRIRPVVVLLLVLGSLACCALSEAQQVRQSDPRVHFSGTQRSFATASAGDPWQRELWEGHKDQVPEIFRNDSWHYIDWIQYRSWQDAQQDFDRDPNLVKWDRDDSGLQWWLEKQSWYVQYAVQSDLPDWAVQKQDAVVWLWNTPNMMNGSAGTAVLVHREGNKGYFSTCRHVIEPRANLVIRYRNGQQAKANLEIHCRNYDAAIVSASLPGDIEPFLLSSDFTQQAVHLVGYGGGKPSQLWHARSKVEEWLRSSDGKDGALLVSRPPAAISGDSGGAFLSADGRLLGIISGGRLAGPQGPELDSRGPGSLVVDKMLCDLHLAGYECQTGQ